MNSLEEKINLNSLEFRICIFDVDIILEITQRSKFEGMHLRKIINFFNFLKCIRFKFEWRKSLFIDSRKSFINHRSHYLITFTFSKGFFLISENY